MSALVLGLASAAAGQPGTLDTSFGVEGFATLHTGAQDGTWSMAVQADGRILVGGTMDLGSSRDFAVLRFLPDGTPDGSFGITGFSMVDIEIGTLDMGSALALQPDGKILLAGGSSGRFALVRYLPNGDRDPAFGTNGVVVTAIGQNGGARAIALQSDGRILAAGFSQGPAGMAVARYTAAGELDATFNGTGTLVIPWPYDLADVHAMAVQEDGRIVLAGSCNVNGTDIGMAFVRLLADGTLDNSFSDDGRTIVEVAGSFDVATSLLLQPDNRIVAGGLALVGPVNHAVAVRLDEEGSLDPTFGDAGIVVSETGNWEEEAWAITTQQDGKLLLGGYRFGQAMHGFALARYSSDGVPDLSFDGDGTVVTEVNLSGFEVIKAMAMQTDGKILAAGNSGNGDLTVARYFSGIEVGSEEHQPDADIRIFPNPASDRVRIEYGTRSSTPVKWTLYDMAGRPMADPNISSSIAPHDRGLTLDLSGLAVGMYVIVVEVDGRSHRVPVVRW